MGIVIGIMCVWGLDALNISVAHNEVLSVLVGGDTFKPMISIAGIVLGMVQLAIVTLLAVLYPIQVARKITPLEAISRD